MEGRHCVSTPLPVPYSWLWRANGITVDHAAAVLACWVTGVRENGRREGVRLVAATSLPRFETGLNLYKYSGTRFGRGAGFIL